MLDHQDVGQLEGDDVDSSVDPNDVVPYDYVEGDDVGHIEGDEYWWLPSDDSDE